MPLEHQEIDPNVDFPALARCLFESYEDPPQKFFHVFFPIHGQGAAAREAAIEEAATRLRAWHAGDPSSRWNKVVDTATGRLAGAALWNVHHENPFAAPHPSDVTWFPAGGARAFVEQALANHSRPRARAAQRAHVYLFIIFAHPDYRRRGVGQQLLDWGLREADAAGLEVFLDSTPYGRPLYEANGFVYIEENINVPATDAPDQAWTDVAEKVQPFTFWLMWRPAGGKYEEGKTVKPWEQSEG
ncbi:hypothetical protein GGS23DRAFT_611052 [Durotheca rogersii]|uniref:uncharacterized protein n=1 Tax=Durotheca rogersii TaxID=419775 RepID=UPI002220EB31|nr:uncharacterized protein GGS23DRAFT_611052 [Durotheca rogersii]KAI5861912.1 hypothetical protein GGS23DRAFT_611052 [Durotheca rogersii]